MLSNEIRRLYTINKKKQKEKEGAAFKSNNFSPLLRFYQQKIEELFVSSLFILFLFFLFIHVIKIKEKRVKKENDREIAQKFNNNNNNNG